MLDRNECMALELGKQQQRLKYIKTVVGKEVYCDYPPRRVFIEPTNVCNANCIHCVHDGQMTRKKGYIEIDLVRKVLEEIKDLNRCAEICLFQHGEPLLHPEIVEIVRLCGTEYDFFTKMNTNGMSLTRELSEALITNHLDYIVFSLDAITPETYKRIKRRDAFYKTINNILDYLEIWGSLETGSVRNYFACDVNILEEDINRLEIPMVKDLFHKLPVGHVNVYPLHNFTGTVEAVNDGMASNWRLSKENWPCCNTPWDILGVRWNGDVTSCIYDYDCRYIVGNVYESSLLEIWNGEPMLRFRRALLDKAYERVEANGSLCSTCSIMWMDDYKLPTNYYKEIKRMQFYIDAAIDRVSRRWERTDILLEKHKYLMEHREDWLRDLQEKTAGLG